MSFESISRDSFLFRRYREKTSVDANVGLVLLERGGKGPHMLLSLLFMLCQNGQFLVVVVPPPPKVVLMFL